MTASHRDWKTIIATSFSFALAIWFLSDTFIIKPLENDKVRLQEKIDSISKNIKISDEYILIQQKVVENAQKAFFYKEQFEVCSVSLSNSNVQDYKISTLESELKECKDSNVELNKKVTSDANVKTELAKLKELLEVYKEALSNRDLKISTLSKNANILEKIALMQKEQRETENELQHLLQYNLTESRRLEVLRLESRIKMLQEQISSLASTLKG